MYGTSWRMCKSGLGTVCPQILVWRNQYPKEHFKRSTLDQQSLKALLKSKANIQLIFRGVSTNIIEYQESFKIQESHSREISRDRNSSTSHPSKLHPWGSRAHWPFVKVDLAVNLCRKSADFLAAKFPSFRSSGSGLAAKPPCAAWRGRFHPTKSARYDRSAGADTDQRTSDKEILPGIKMSCTWTEMCNRKRCLEKKHRLATLPDSYAICPQVKWLNSLETVAGLNKGQTFGENW